MAEATELQNLIVPCGSTSRQFVLSGNKLYIQRITRAGVPYIADISYVTTPERVWESGLVTELMINYFRWYWYN